MKNKRYYLLFILIVIAVAGFSSIPLLKENAGFLNIHNYKVNDVDDTEVKNHDYNLELLFNEPFNDGNYKAVKCIDISAFQENVDFKKVKESGIDYVYLRIGSRGYTKGSIYEDSKFDEYYELAKEAGIKVGAYFFSQSVTVKEAIDEAFFCEERLKGKEIDLEVVYDFEYIIEAEARTDDLSNELKTDMALAFCQKIEEAGYKPMIYANYDQLTTQYDLKKIMNYPIWYAHYDVELPVFEKEFIMWQYTPNGRVDGIEGNVDLDYRIIKTDSQY